VADSPEGSGQRAPLRERLLAVLPRGSTLPQETWLRRHRALLILLWAHAFALGLYAYLEGYGLGHSVQEGGVVAALAALATLAGSRRRLASALVSVGLMTGSAVLVHLSGGFIEAHFHFFVILILLTLYEDWVPFLVAAGYVLIHHGIAGTLDPESVYNHPDAIANPWKWAGIHALFITAAGAAGMTAWKLNEKHREATEEALRLARDSDRSRAEAQQLARLGSFEFDSAGGQVTWSAELFEIFGLDPETTEPSYERYMGVVHPQDRDRVADVIAQALERGKDFNHQYRAVLDDGSHRVFHARGEIATGPDGRRALLGTCQDITERARVETEARQRAMEQAAVAALGDGALRGGALDDLMREASGVVARVLDVDVGAVLIRADDERGGFRLRGATGIPEHIADMWIPGGHGSQAGYTLETDGPVIVADWKEERRFSRSPTLAEIDVRSGATVPIRGSEATFGVLGVQSRTVREFSAEDINFLQSVAHVVASAIQRSGAEREMRHQALHDPLTGLPNRNLFTDRLAHALELARRHGSQVAVLFGDLDQFKLVNDSLGHEAGDELLRAVAPRINGVLRDADTIARFGGDEFAILVEEVASELDATRVAERIQGALGEPFVLRGRDHFVSATLGIAIGSAEVSPEALIRDADAAMYRAKERGRGTYELFDEVMRARAHDHLRIENDMQRALERDEFEVHYQPVIELESMTVSGVEALVRWNHPERGMLAPAAFIQIAEESGMIDRIGAWVLERACRDAVTWQPSNGSGRPIGISVNLSVRQISNPAMVETVSSVIECSGIASELVSLEITESALLDDTDATLATLARLKRLHVGLVLDDFGTGFSSLGYLQRFDFDALKLDRAFISRLVTDPGDAAIVGAVTKMAKALGLEVVAEGVETDEQLERIRNLGCRFAQGFLFSRPLPISEFTELLGRPRGAQPSPAASG
jgi:diguanylate cyclase (GGDEF)-like protein/PAS domain S-box-containing protein